MAHDIVNVSQSVTDQSGRFLCHHFMVLRVGTCKAENILSLDCRRKKTRAYHKYKKNTAMKDCLQAVYTIIQYNQTVPYRYINVMGSIFFFVFLVSFFFPPAVQPYTLPLALGFYTIPVQKPVRSPCNTNTV